INQLKTFQFPSIPSSFSHSFSLVSSATRRKELSICTYVSWVEFTAGSLKKQNMTATARITGITEYSLSFVVLGRNFVCIQYKELLF
ncbi:hypothetical protein LINPERHAP2_LOCUS8564, partial [Linum perenne]